MSRKLNERQRDMSIAIAGNLLGMVDCMISYSKESAEHRIMSDPIDYSEHLPEFPTNTEAMKFLRFVCTTCIERIDKAMGSSK